MRSGIRTAAIGIVAAALAAERLPAQGPPPATVYVAPVVQQELQEMRRVTGELRALARSTVATIEPGLVMEMRADEGSLVRAGDVLAVLDSRRLELELARMKALKTVAEAAVEVARAELDMEERNRASLVELQKRGGSNPKEAADAESMVKMTRASLSRAERDVDAIAAQADLLETRLSDMTITAPFDGQVVVLHTEQGQWVAEGDGIVDLLSTSSFEAWLDVPQRFAPALAAVDAAVQVEIDATGDTFGPARPTVVRQVDRVGRSFNAFFRIDDDSGRLAPGMSVTGWVPSGARQSYLTVPRDALMRNDIGFYVYRVQQQGEQAVAMPAQVTTLFQIGDRTVIAPGGLSDGDRVIIEGNERLYPTAPIIPTASPAETADST